MVLWFLLFVFLLSLLCYVKSNASSFAPWKYPAVITLYLPDDNNFHKMICSHAYKAITSGDPQRLFLNNWKICY